ncbi:hypothetical protein ABPG77_000306 [Micractinium sp. CCAP 211/92]
MEEAQLSEALSALVDSAVQRLISAGVGPSLEMEEELRLLRQTNEELLAALQVDEVELSRLHGVLFELEKKCAELEAVQRQAHVPEQAQQQRQQSMLNPLAQRPLDPLKSSSWSGG